MIERLGVLGGMFDPVHRGHIKAAQYALEILRLDRIRLVPCYLPNHRGPASAPAEERLEMLRLATAGLPNLEVDDIEVTRRGTSYTADTLSAYKESLPDATLVFILGADAYAGFTQWHNWQHILELAHLALLARGEVKVPENVRQETQFETRVETDQQKLFQSSAGKIFLASGFNYEASSTDVRNALQSGATEIPELDPSVRCYISSKSLYHA